MFSGNIFASSELATPREPYKVPDVPSHFLRSSLAERVRDALRSEILHGRWPSDLPSEQHLSEECQVSRPTIHTALLSLQRDGLIQFRRGLPWRVISRTVAVRPANARQSVVMLLYNNRLIPNLDWIMPFIDPLREKVKFFCVCKFGK